MNIEGVVAEVVNEYTIVVNIGSEDGVESNHQYGVYSESDPIEDPQTGEELGQIEYKIIEVKPTDINENYTIMETNETVGGFSIYPQYKKRPKKLADNPDFQSGRDYVEPGDIVKFIKTIDDD